MLGYAALVKQVRKRTRGGKRSQLVNVEENFQLFASPAKVKPRNTVGAGDALLAAVARQISSL